MEVYYAVKFIQLYELITEFCWTDSKKGPSTSVKVHKKIYIQFAQEYSTDSFHSSRFSERET